MSLHLDSPGGVGELDRARGSPIAGMAEEAGPDLWKLRCPECGGGDHAVVSGDVLLVESIDVREGASPAGAKVGGS